MSSRAWRIGALASLTAALAACGGSHRRAASGQNHQLPGLATASSEANGGQPSRGSSALSSRYAIALPLSTAGPTTCTVYQPGSGTQIVFDSQTLNVRVECQAWAASESGDGYLWGYERAAMPDANRLCSLTDPQRKLTASVIEQTAFVPLSTADREKAISACTTIRASGWIEDPVRVTPNLPRG